MSEPKPVYCIKSRGGRIEKEGDFATIEAWLRENRITSDDDLRRLGFHVLERDELWARVKDFPEFNLTERQGRRALTRAKNWNYLCMLAGLVFLGIGFALICYDQLIPRYTESNRVDEARAEAKSAKELEKVAYEKLRQAREETAAVLKEKDAAVRKSIDQLNKQLDETREELSRALAQKQGELKNAQGRLDDLSVKISADLAAANRRIALLTKQLEEEKKETATAQKPLRDKMAELQSRNDALYSLYVRASDQLKAERDKSIAQKVFGLSNDKGE